MNFSPFGGHFPTSIPSIHQFAAKFGHETSGSGIFSGQDGSARYATNTMAGFNQHPAPQQQQHPTNVNKYQTSPYINQNGIYPHQNNTRTDKRQNYNNQHEITQELCTNMLQGQEQKQINEKVKNIFLLKKNINYLNFVFI